MHILLQRIMPAFLFLLSGCRNEPVPAIDAVCLRDPIGNYVLKWETEPVTPGIMKLYVSDNPDTFQTETSVGYADSNDGIMTYITNDNITRKYFILALNDKYFRSVSSRSVAMDSIQNLRDIGGYTNSSGQSIRWGKVFRSGEIRHLSSLDSLRFNNLGIKTIIDLRSIEEQKAFPVDPSQTNIVSIPVSLKNQEQVYKKLLEGQMRKGDGLLFMQDMYLNFVKENSEQFGKALKVFLSPSDYPILITCPSGKDRSGFLTALLLEALGIEEEQILDDYTASNLYIDRQRLTGFAARMSTDSQEAMTVLLSANEDFMTLALNQIRKDYGSVDKYLSKKRLLSQKERNTLKEILLQ